MGADDGLGQVLADLADGARAIGQVDTVKAQPFHQKDMAFDHHGHVAGMGGVADRVGGPQDAVFVACGERDAQAGNIGGIQHCGKLVGIGVEVQFRRGDQVDLRAVLVGHGALRHGFGGD